MSWSWVVAWVFTLWVIHREADKAKGDLSVLIDGIERDIRDLAIPATFRDVEERLDTIDRRIDRLSDKIDALSPSHPYDD